MARNDIAAPRSYPRLLSPGQIGPVNLPNRVIMSAMDMNLSTDGIVEPGDIAHFVARAAGGTGMIITGCCSVAPLAAGRWRHGQQPV